MIGLGQTMCILTGGIDLSVPWTFTGAAVLTSILANGDSSKLPQVLLLVLGLAIVVGLVKRDDSKANPNSDDDEPAGALPRSVPAR